MEVKIKDQPGMRIDIGNRAVALHNAFYRRLPSLILKGLQTTADLQRLRPQDVGLDQVEQARIVPSWSCWWQGATPPPRCISLTDRQRKMSPMQFCPLVLLKDQPPAFKRRPGQLHRPHKLAGITSDCRVSPGSLSLSLCYSVKPCHPIGSETD